MICYAAIACIFGLAEPVQEQTEIVATGTIPAIVALQDVPTPRPSPRPRREIRKEAPALAFAAAAPSIKTPFDKILGKRLQLIKVDGNEVIDRFSPTLLSIMADIQRHFGRPIEVQSGYRSPSHNRRVGGAKRSLHMTGRAADIRVPGVPKHRLLAFLRSHPRVGGIGYFMSGGFIHIDDGRKRTWTY